MINGSHAVVLEVLKVSQLAALAKAGIDTPCTPVVVGTGGLQEAARHVPLPFLDPSRTLQP